MKASLFYRVAAVLLLFLLSDIPLVFASPIPIGELIPCLAQCGPFTSTCRGLAGPIGTFLLRLDSLSACFIFRGDIGVATRWPSGRDA